MRKAREICIAYATNVDTKLEYTYAIRSANMSNNKLQ